MANEESQRQRRKIEGRARKQKTDKKDRKRKQRIYKERQTEEKGRKKNTGKVEHRKRKTEKSRLVGSEKTKMKKCMLYLEKKQQQRKEGRKQWK